MKKIIKRLLHRKKIKKVSLDDLYNFIYNLFEVNSGKYLSEQYVTYKVNEYFKCTMWEYVITVELSWLKFDGKIRKSFMKDKNGNNLWIRETNFGLIKDLWRTFKYYNYLKING